MLVPNRHGSSNSYRYGFNGMEKDDELKGEGNSYDFGARMLDPRVGRWFAPDKLEGKYPSYSTYSAFGNTPLFFVDKDGNENIIYIVNVPDSNGKKSISDKELQKRIDKANAILQSKAEEGGYELKTKYVLFNPDVQIPKRGPFSRNGMDKNDGVILIGNFEDIKTYDRKYNVTGFDNEAKAKGNSGWVPYRKFGGSRNPEITDGGSKRGAYIDTSTTSDDEQVFLILHASGHMKRTPHKFDDHAGNENTPNIMLSGDEQSAYLRHNSKARYSDLWSNKLSLNQTAFKNRMIRNFGENEAVDNYDKNINENKTQYGPRNEDGSF